MTYVCAVSSKMLHAITPSLSLVSSLPSTSKASDVEKVDPASLDVEGDLNLRSRNISSTLHKLYLWEKKLYEEVKVHYYLLLLPFRFLYAGTFWVLLICLVAVIAEL